MILKNASAYLIAPFMELMCISYSLIRSTVFHGLSTCKGGTTEQISVKFGIRELCGN
jgi:hypothetical protein